MGSNGNGVRESTVFGCLRRVRAQAVWYELVMPAARLLAAEPLLDHAFRGDRTGADFPVVLGEPLRFDPIDDVRGRGIVTVPLGTPFDFEGLPAIRHGMVRVTLIAPLPATAWRLDEPLLPAAA